MSEKVMQMEEPIEFEKKIIRRRKKQLYKNIRNQMEFYFSDANLSKNRFIGQLIQQDPFVDLTVFMGFNKIKALTSNIEDIVGSLKKSTYLKLNDECTKVARITPFEPKHDSDECTIYVEQLPPDVSHEWLKDKFSSFGEVVYVSIPKYKTTGKIKGFAFVEFDSIVSAQKALQEYISMGCCLPSQMLPEELCSITAFQEEENQEINETQLKKEEGEELNNEINEYNNKDELPLETNKKLKKKLKRKIDDTSFEESSSNKNEDSDFVEDNKDANKRQKVMEEDSNKEQNKSLEEENLTNVEKDVEETENNPEGKENKKKRKRKKKKKMKMQIEENFKLQIMPKKEWKRLRNKYLELQKNKMKNLKQYLNNVKWANTPQNNQSKENPKEKEEKNPFEFIPGVILKVTFDEPIKDIKNFKSEAHSLQDIKYIDTSEGANEAYIRFSSGESTLNAFEKKVWENIQILEGKEEKNYWEKMKKDREERFQNRIKPKIRGRTKLLKRAEKALGKHIRFD